MVIMREQLEPKHKLHICRPWRYLLSIVVIIILLGAGSGWYIIRQQLEPPEPGSPPVEVVIPPGASSGTVSSILVKKGIIKNPVAFRMYVVLSGKDRQLKSGYYSLSPGLSLPEVVDILVAGKVQDIEFTVPEGYTIKQIARLLQQKGILEEDEFLQAVQKDYSFDFLKSIPRDEYYLEGFLYPDTYRISRETSPRDIVLMMLKRFEQVYNDIYIENEITKKYSTREIVVLASMVEREAKVDEERPVIAGVFLNRLRRGMRLESCATIEYLLPEPKPVLTHEDLQIDSPYNTYRTSGLPPGPIANPGRASLEAVINPAETNYLYFVAKPDGTHYFSSSLAEHNRAVMRYQKNNS